jgi:hypothetical protein
VPFAGRKTRPWKSRLAPLQSILGSDFKPNSALRVREWVDRLRVRPHNLTLLAAARISAEQEEGPDMDAALNAMPRLPEQYRLRNDGRNLVVYKCVAGEPLYRVLSPSESALVFKQA